MPNDTASHRKLEQRIRELEEALRLHATEPEQAAWRAYTELDQTLNAIGDGIRVVDADKKVLRVNQAFLELFGVSREQVLGKACDLIPCPDCNTERCCLRRLEKDEECVDSEVDFTTSDGAPITCLVTVTALRNHGRLTGAVQLFKDVTSRKLAEETLRRQTTLLETTINAIPDLICLKDGDGRWLMANDFALDFFGIRKADYPGRTYDDLIGSRKRFKDAFQVGRESDRQAWAGRAPYRCVETLPGPDGRPRFFDLVKVPIFNPDGSRQALVVAGHDITRRKEAEERFRLAQEEWELTFNAISEIVTIQDPDMRITRINRAGCRALEQRPENILGRHCYEIFHGADTPCPGCPVTEATRIFSPYSAEIAHPHLNKTFSVSATPILDQEDRLVGVAHFAKDITGQKKLEAQFRQAQKMEAIGRLTGGIAHDFNNLLSTIIGFSEIILAELPAESRLRQDIETIHEAGDRAAALTRQLLAFSRKQVLAVQPVNLNRLIDNMARMLRRMIGEDIELVIHTRATIGMVNADPVQIEQVLMNLAVNARDAMPEGGTLTIETGPAELDASYAQSHQSVPPGTYALFSVTDTGCGIPPEVRDKIFEPFFTTKQRSKGTGLGLATIYGIIKQHHGYIYVYSEPGRGTTFKIYLPVAEASTTGEAAPETTEPARGSETILVADDETNIRRLVTRTLTPLGYRVLEAANGHEAITLVKTAKETIDLLLTDVVMPGMNGRELAAELKAIQPDLKVVYMSGYTDNVIVHQGILDPGTRFLPKPLAPGQLAEKLRLALDERDE